MSQGLKKYQLNSTIYYLLSFSLTHSFLHSLIHFYPYSFQKHVLLANDFSPDLSLLLSRVAFGGRHGGGNMIAEFRECIHNLGELVSPKLSREGGKFPEG